ncbi:MAG: glycoside hydrolase family 28 protein, partial [Ignavibacteriota bacterium]
MNWFLPVAVLIVSAPGALGATFDVKTFGATGDGQHKETAAIARAIDAAAKAGGGTVVVPPGRYLTGAVTLKSNVAFEVEAGATLLGSPDPEDYPLHDSVWGERQEYSSLIYADGAEHITLRGRGTIDGQGQNWWKRMGWPDRRKIAPEQRTAAERAELAKLANGRPHMIKLVRCKYVVIEGLHLINSAEWTVHPLLCEFVRIDGITIENPVPSPNTDGINPESCRNVQIMNSRIDVGDDCVTLKSGKDAAGRRVGRPDENITITNCVMLRGHGGVTIGSEMSGGVRNVVVSNCVFQGTDVGIRVKSQRGRGGVGGRTGGIERGDAGRGERVHAHQLLFGERQAGRPVSGGRGDAAVARFPLQQHYGARVQDRGPDHGAEGDADPEHHVHRRADSGADGDEDHQREGRQFPGRRNRGGDGRHGYGCGQCGNRPGEIARGAEVGRADPPWMARRACDRRAIRRAVLA